MVKRLLSYQTLVFIAHGETWKSSYNNNKFKISAPTWNHKFELPDGSYSLHCNIQPENIQLEYGEIIVWFTDQNSQPLKTEVRINLKMMVK